MEHRLSKEELAHLNAIIDHYNDLHPDHKEPLITYARDTDHANMTDWVKGTVEFLGLAGISTAGISGIAAYFLKHLRELHWGR